MASHSLSPMLIFPLTFLIFLTVMMSVVVCQLPNENLPIARALLIDHQTLLFNAQLANEMEQFEDDLVNGLIMGRDDCIDSIEEHIDQCFENHLPDSGIMAMRSANQTCKSAYKVHRCMIEAVCDHCFTEEGGAQVCHTAARKKDPLPSCNWYPEPPKLETKYKHCWLLFAGLLTVILIIALLLYFVLTRSYTGRQFKRRHFCCEAPSETI